MSDNWTSQVNEKLPDGALINLRAQSGEEMGILLDTFPMEKYIGFKARLRAAVNATPIASPSQETSVPTTTSSPAAAAPPASNGLPAEGAVSPEYRCPHGQYVWKNFTSKAGRHTLGWFCPSQERTECKPQFRKLSDYGL